MALLALLTACAGGRQALPGAPRQLPADSLALLEAAIERAKPAYPTQAEAIRAGVYAEGKLARERKREEAARVAAAPTPAGSAVADPEGPSPTAPEPAQPGTPSRGSPEGAPAAPASSPGANGELAGAGAAAASLEDTSHARSAVSSPGTTRLPVETGASERSGTAPLPADGGRFVIQIGAFPQPGPALAAAERASLRFPGTEPVIEWAGGVYRAAIGAWHTRDDAAARLASVREAYPGAWVRERSRR